MEGKTDKSPANELPDQVLDAIAGGRGHYEYNEIRDRFQARMMQNFDFGDWDTFSGQWGNIKSVIDGSSHSEVMSKVQKWAASNTSSRADENKWIAFGAYVAHARGYDCAQAWFDQRKGAVGWNFTLMKHD